MRNFLLVPFGIAVGYLLGGVVGMAAGATAAVNASNPRIFTRFIVNPLFVGMVLASILQGEFEQELYFGLDRPIANQFGLILIVVLAVMVFNSIVTPQQTKIESGPVPFELPQSSELTGGNKNTSF